MKLYQIKREEVVVGEPLPWSAHDKDGILLLEKGYIIETESQLDAIIERGLYLIVPEVHAADRTVRVSPFRSLNRVQVQLERLFGSPEIEEGFSSTILKLCLKIQEAVTQDPDAALGSILLQGEEKYTVKHPVHTALICELVSLDLGWPGKERCSLLAAALTMNIGMIFLQERLFRRGGEVSEAERQEIHHHPERGVNILLKAGVKDKTWLKAVLQHHERTDGGGYPRGVKGDAILVSARILSIGDIYSARATGRGYRPGISATKALQEMFLDGEHGPDKDLEKRFIKALGIYPPGSFVRLNNGEIAVVTERGATIENPIVRSVVKPNGERLGKPKRRDCYKDEFAVKGIIPPAEVDIEVNRYKLWGYYEYRTDKDESD